MVLGKGYQLLNTDLTYKGSWNALTNVPALASGTGTKGFSYKVSAAGTTDLDGNNNWAVGDIATFNGLIWERFPANFVPNIAGPSANTIVVSKTGNDSTGDGTMGRPFATANAALNVANSGDTVLVFPGVYIENITFKAGVNICSLSKLSTTFIGNHVTNFTGAAVVQGIVFSATSGACLTFSGSNVQSFQANDSIFTSASGDPINWTNSNVLSSMLLDGCSVNFTGNGSGQRAFDSISSANGTLIAYRTDFLISNLDNPCMDIAGGLVVIHQHSQVKGQINVFNTAQLTATSVTHMTSTVPVLNTTSSGMTTFLDCTDISSANPIITGTGAFSYCQTLLGGTGSGSANTLNGGIGSIVLKTPLLRFRAGPLKPVVQDGLLEYDGSHLYFSIGTVRTQII